MKRYYNFSAGPGCLPLAILERAKAELVCYNDAGLSVMEMSHRSPVYEDIIARAESSLRKLMKIPANYKILFLQGGATMQFSAIPMNLLNGSGKADYVISGQFSAKAYDEAKAFGDVKILASSKEANFKYIPEFSSSDIRPDADYVHICYNNTIFGTSFQSAPDTAGIPLVADVSSCILSEPTDVSKYGLLYAGAQKNIGPAGVTIVIVRDDLIGKARAGTPSVLDYKIQAENTSMLNTPPTYAVYMAGLMFDYLINDIGGLDAMAKINREKAAILYDYLDSTDFYNAHADKKFRSLMNIPFFTNSEELDNKFCKEAEKSGLITIKGHRAVGGMRASIYNSMPTEGVKALVDFMRKFESENK